MTSSIGLPRPVLTSLCRLVCFHVCYGLWTASRALRKIKPGCWKGPRRPLNSRLQLWSSRPFYWAQQFSIDGQVLSTCYAFSHALLTCVSAPGHFPCGTFTRSVQLSRCFGYWPINARHVLPCCRRFCYPNDAGGVSIMETLALGAEIRTAHGLDSIGQGYGSFGYSQGRFRTDSIVDALSRASASKDRNEDARERSCCSFSL